MQSKKLDGAVADGEGHLFMALRDRNSIVKIDMAAHRLDAQWKTDGCEQPTGVAYDRAGQRVFVGCRGAKPVLAVMDAQSGRVISTHAVALGNDAVLHDADAPKGYRHNGRDATP